MRKVVLQARRPGGVEVHIVLHGLMRFKVPCADAWAIANKLIGEVDFKIGDVLAEAIIGGYKFIKEMRPGHYSTVFISSALANCLADALRAEGNTDAPKDVSAPWSNWSI